MTLEQFELLLDCTPPSIYVVEWAFSLRSMFLMTGLKPYEQLANMLSDILEDYPYIARIPLENTPVARLIIHRLLLTSV